MERMSKEVMAMARALHDTKSFMLKGSFDLLHDRLKSDLLSDAVTILSALKEAGFVMVPIEPTENMIAAGAEKMDPMWGYPDDSIAKTWAKDGYRAMIAAQETE